MSWPALPPAQKSLARSIGEPAFTDAVEFEDGKLMLGKHESLRGISWNSVLERVPLPELKGLASNARLIAWVNWTCIDRMSEILERFLTLAAAGLTGPKRVAFFDLADPAKRSQAALQGVLELIGAYHSQFEVVLGMNLAEARKIAQALGLPAPSEEAPSALECAAAARLPRHRSRDDPPKLHSHRFEPDSVRAPAFLADTAPARRSYG